MKRLLLSVFLISLTISVFSQRREPFQNELYVGFGGGVLASRIDFRPAILQGLQYAPHAGISIKHISDIDASGTFRGGIIGEVNFAQRGWVEEFDLERHPDFAYSRALNYLEIPFMAHANVGRRNVRFIIHAGPQIGILLWNNYTMSETLTDHVATQEHPRYSRYGAIDRRFEYGIVGGSGLQLRTGVGVFNLEGRYYFGLGDIFENRRSRQAFFSRSSNQVISVRLTYYMRIF